MWTAILVDDESPALQLMGKLIEEHTELRIVGTYTRSSEALEEARRLAPDIAFLDIEMPVMGGLELASRLHAILPRTEIVFVTAYKEYALEAFGVSALDYLLKPVNLAGISRCWDRLKRRLPQTQALSEPSPARIVCFGGFEVYGPGHAEPARFSTSKVEELMAFMIASGGNSVSKWEICEKLWPDSEPERSEQNLYTAVYRLKKSFAEYNLRYQLESQRGSYRLIGVGACELYDFERAIEDVSDVERKSVDEVERIFALHRGPLFQGKGYSWIYSQQERFQRKYSLLGKQLACAYIEIGQGKRAISTLLQLLQQDPLDEETYELLLETFAHMRERSSFLACYDKYKDMLETELGLKVKPRMQQLLSDVLEAI